MKLIKIEKYSAWQERETLSVEEQLALVRINPNQIQWMKNPCDLAKVEAFARQGYLIKFEHNPSIEMQMAAVQSNDIRVIGLIKNPSIEVQLEAVKGDGYAIQYIKNPTLEVQLMAITGNQAKEIIPNINHYIPNQHPDLAKEYIKWVRNKME